MHLIIKLLDISLFIQNLNIQKDKRCKFRFIDYIHTNLILHKNELSINQNSKKLEN